jgi:hypothetical protein
VLRSFIVTTPSKKKATIEELPPVVLEADEQAELEKALEEADDDFKHGRHVPREAVFPRTRLAG